MGQSMTKKACLDASPAIVQEMAYAGAMKCQKFSANVKKTYGGGVRDSSSPICYNCAKPGHLQKDNKRPKGTGQRGTPGLCPQCKKGKHWKNECKSKFHKNGTILDKDKNKHKNKNKNQTNIKI